MKNFKIIAGFILGLTICCGLANGMEEKFEKNEISFRFSDKGFDLEIFFLMNCKRDSKKLDGSFNKYLNDLYTGKIKEYKTELACLNKEQQKVLTKISNIKNPNEQKLCSDRWNPILTDHVKPIEEALTKFINIQGYVIDGNSPKENRWDELFNPNHMSQEKMREPYFESCYFSAHREVKNNLEVNKFTPFKRNHQIFLSAYLDRLFHGEISDPENELRGVKILIEYFKQLSEPATYKTLLCSKCGVNQTKHVQRLYEKNIPILPSLRKIQSILEEVFVIKEIIENQQIETKKRHRKK